MRRAHLFMACVWVVLAVPTALWWRDSVLWVAILSLYANFASEISAYQATRAEENNDGGDEPDDDEATARQQRAAEHRLPGPGNGAGGGHP